MENLGGGTTWRISIIDERNFLDKYLIILFINPPKHCKYCKKGDIYIRKNNSLINPYLDNVIIIHAKEKFI